jgi:hypothetical protein
MTQTHSQAAAPSYPAPPTPPQVDAAPVPHRRNWVLPILTLVVAIAAGVMAGIALSRQGPEQAVPTSTPSGITAPTPAEVAAAKTAACDAWKAASVAINSARRPFIDSPSNWNDPVTVNALTQAQAGALIQVEYVRQHLSAATPQEVAAPIRDYIAAVIDTVAADGQHADAAVANAAADRSTSAAARIKDACGS